IGFGPKEKSPMAPLRASTTKSEWLPDDPTAFVPTMLWKLPFITTWDGSRNQNHPTDSAEEAEKAQNPPGLRHVSRDVREKGDLGYAPKIRIDRVCGWHAADGIDTRSEERRV